MPLVKQDTFGPDTFVVDTICNWLSGRPSYTGQTPTEETQTYLDGILQKFGYNEPYTPEQRAINAMLLIKKADAFTCQVAWEFYNDYTASPSEHEAPLAA